MSLLWIPTAVGTGPLSHSTYFNMSYSPELLKVMGHLIFNFGASEFCGAFVELHLCEAGIKSAVLVGRTND